MKRTVLTLASALVFAATASFAQETNGLRVCGTMEHQHMLEQMDPTIKQTREEIEKNIDQYESYLRTNPDNSVTAVVIIPTVFHIVWNTSAESLNVSRVNDQLNVLNQDFRKLNADIVNVPTVWQGIAADCEVQFCKAQRTPTGAATTGVTYTNTTVTAFGMSGNPVKYTASGGINIWDRTKYLNVWVCDISGGILGYAQFPGGPAATDGVVIDYAYFGTTGSTPPYNKGRTATHEIGHWLNLYHIWGDDGNACTGSDQVADTPNQANENYTCHPPFTVVTDACSPSAPGKMWQNYMDYTDDACMYMFTNGQKTRIVSCLGGTRLSLQTSNGCTPVSTGVDEYTTHSVNLVPNPNQGQFIIFSPSYPLENCRVNVFDALGNLVKSFTNDHSVEIAIDVRGIPNGIYFVELDNGIGKVTKRLIIAD